MTKIQYESRKSKRRLVLHGAQVAGLDGSFLESCRIFDVSEGGARLKVADPTNLPDRFLLLLSRDGVLRRQCAVIWRAEDTLGVEFIRPQSKSG